MPYLKCLGLAEADYALWEVHEGIYGEHLGARALSTKVLRQGFFWLTLRSDATELVKKCDKCQRHAPKIMNPPADLQSIIAPWPFAQWGIDLLGPFPMATAQRKFLIIMIDYFTKWVEAEPLATITEKKIEDAIWRNIICRFGIPWSITTDHGTQFDNATFRSFCKNLQIRLQFASVSYPQANGQVEVTNRTILHGIKKRLDTAKGRWVEELHSVLWAYRTTPRTPTGESPFKLCFGVEAVIPVEIGTESLRTRAFNAEENEVGLRQKLDLIEETREQALLRNEAYKQRVARHVHRRVKYRSFKEGDLVLRRSEITNAHQAEGKLAPKWEGPYRIISMLGPNTCQLATPDGHIVSKTWNTCYLKKYYQ